MLTFKNSEGKKVMEMTDNGEVKVTDKKLEESFEKEVTQLKENKGEAE